jgi:F-type H+-transporting ATPase subunit b
VADILNSFGIDWRFLLIQIVGFAILLMVLAKFAFGPIYKMLEARQSNIRGNLDEAESRRNEMVRLQQDYETRLAQIEDEARDKIQAAIKEAQAARDEILEKAREDAARITQRASDEIASERAKAMAEMRDEIANMAVAAAMQAVRGNLNSGNHAALIDQAIASIGSTPGAGNASAGRLN